MKNDRKPLFSAKNVIAFVILFVVSAAGLVFGLRGSIPGMLTDRTTPAHIPIDASSQPGAVATDQEGQDYGMIIRLSNGQAQPQPVEILPPATGEPLSPGQIAQITSRLPTLPALPGDQTEFKLPQEVLPPPRPGKTIKQTFPPVETMTAPVIPTIETGPLQVLRFAPEGEIPIAPFVSVTFNQPMVPLGTLGDLAAEDVPVRIEPSLPGTWRWLGTKTLTFEYDSALVDRLPKATEYRATVRAGTKSASGGVLAEAVSWTFSTPAPRVTLTYPNGSPQPLAPVFFVAFDQRIDPAAVLRTVRVTAGGRPIALVLASQADLEKDPGAAQLAKSGVAGRWLAFRAVEPFPTETLISVTIGPGTPSAGGASQTQPTLPTFS